MATFRDTLALVVTADAQNAIRELDKVGKKANGEFAVATNAVDKWAARLQYGGAAAVGFSYVAGRALVTAGKSASDLSESLNKSNVIFGSAAKTVENFADSAAKSMGQSKRAALDAAATFGGLFTNIGKTDAEAADMSMTMVKLAGDLASFGNTSPEEAVLALGSALRGENEPIRQFNVLLDDATLKQRALSMGLVESATATLPPAIKAQAAYAEILAQTSAAQGDFARTSDGAANQQRILSAEFENLKASIGEGVLPVMTAAVGGLNSLMDAFNGLPDGARSTAGGIAAVGVSAAGAIGSVSFLAGSVMKMRERFLAVPAQGLAGGLNNFGVAAGAAGIAAVGLGVAFTALQGQSKKAQERVDNLTDAVRKNGNTLGEAVGNEIAKYLGKNRDVEAVMGRLGISVGDVTAAIQGNEDAYKRLNNIINEFGKVEMMGPDVEASERLRGLVDNQRKAFKDARSEIEGANKATQELSRTNLDGTTATAALGAEADKTADALNGQADAQQNLTDKTKNYLDAVLGANGAVRDQQAAVRDAKQAAEEYDQKIAEATSSAHSNAEAERNRAAVEADVQDKIDKVVSSTAEMVDKTMAGASASDRAKASHDYQRQALVELANSFAPGSTAWNYIQGLIMQLDAAARPRSATLRYNLAVTANGAFVDPATATEFSRRFSGGSFGIGASANGGPVEGGVPRLVGERGPELFVPRQDGRIVPNHVLRSSQPMSAPGVGGASVVVNVTLNNPTGNGPELVREITRALRQGTGQREIVRALGL